VREENASLRTPNIKVNFIASSGVIAPHHTEFQSEFGLYLTAALFMAEAVEPKLKCPLWVDSGSPDLA
jgi:hypothetical protein